MGPGEGVVGWTHIFAPCMTRARKASGNAISQQTRMPMGPRGVSMMVWSSSFPVEVRWGRSGCQRFFFV